MSVFRKHADVYLLGALQKPGQPRMATPWNWVKRMLKRRKRASRATLIINRAMRVRK